jgi:hypothetical protein
MHILRKVENSEKKIWSTKNRFFFKKLKITYHDIKISSTQMQNVSRKKLDGT